MAISNDYVFVPTLNGIAVYGRKYDGIQPSIVEQWTFEGNEDTLVSCISPITTGSTPQIHAYYEKSSDSSHKAYVIFNDNEYSATDYYSSGYVESRNFTGDGFFAKKSINEIHVAYELESSN